MPDSAKAYEFVGHHAMSGLSPGMRSEPDISQQFEFMRSRLDGGRGCGKTTRRANFRFRRRANQI
jgi:hypothetical protein